MIPLKQIPWQSNDWTAALADAITDPVELLRRLSLTVDDVDYAPDFPLRVPHSFVARMLHSDPHDPLLRQVLPLSVERIHAPGYAMDPLAEAAATREPGVIQKYQGRALLIAAPVCAVHCRYCFRRTFPYAQHQHPVAFPNLGSIERDETITEVILSGGDPLMLRDAALARLLARISAIDHVRRLRIHTRVPVVIPQRVTAELVELLKTLRTATAVVLHINHPNEIAGAFLDALAVLSGSGVTLLNQSVLLAGINDDADVLDALSQRLFEHRVLPYYLHLPDRVVGTHHFDVAEGKGRALLAELSARLPGYLVPRLVREVPGATSKVVLRPA